MEDGVLFKMSYLNPMLRCVGPLQVNYIIREVHEGACGMHSGPRTVVAKLIRQGYYWPTILTPPKLTSQPGAVNRSTQERVQR